MAEVQKDPRLGLRWSQPSHSPLTTPPPPWPSITRKTHDWDYAGNSTMETAGGQPNVREIVADPLFNLPALLLACGEQDDWDARLDDPTGLFSRSPLTSLSNSRCSSRAPSPLSSVSSSRAATPPPTLDPLPSVVTLSPPQPPPSTHQPPRPPSLQPKNPRQARLQKKSHGRQRKDRADRRRTETRDNVFKKHVDGASTIQVQSALADSEVTSGAYTGARPAPSSKVQYQLRQLIGRDSKFKFRRVRWDGISPTRIVDRDRRLVAILAGRPSDPLWSQKMMDAADAMDRLRPFAHEDKVKGKKKPNRRGKFIALRVGISHGGGQRRPANLSNHRANKSILDELQSLPFFYQAAGFASGVLKYWTPKLFARYEKVLKSLEEHYPDVVRNFHHSVFAASSYNLGPTTVCNEHTDFSNLPFGLCAVTSLGTFNPRRGGHLVLKECRLVIEFPPGSTILLPSAIITHSNTRLSPGERRYSAAQYTAGPLFRWVDNEFKKAEVYRGSLSKEGKRAMAERDGNRWTEGLQELPTYGPSL